jgi:hypothetical protein
MAKAKKKPELRDLTFEKFVQRPPELTVLTDHPLSGEEIEESFADDPFNFRYKLGPVFDILRHPGTITPAAILISGGWGTGKTSAMKWLEYLLDKWNKTSPSGGTKVRPIWFYPWKYDSKEDVRKGLIASVILNAIDVKMAGWKTVRKALKLIAMFLGKSTLDLLESQKVSIEGFELSGGALRKIIKNFREAAHPEVPYLNPFEAVMEAWVRDSLGTNQRMVIFIDDLDRCMPEIALMVLESMKLYLNISDLVFVLGVDKDVVERLVVEHYKKLGLVRSEEKDKQKPETEEEKAEAKLNRARHQQDEQKAKLYLSKMFQVEIELSPKEEQIREFLDACLTMIPYWTEKLSEEHKKLFRGLVLTLAGRNPREVKRILNSALMSGTGAEMIKIEGGIPELKFEQGLQDFFIRRILQKPQYERLAGMIDTDEGRKFFHDWSQFVVDQRQANPERLNPFLPEYACEPETR